MSDKHVTDNSSVRSQQAQRNLKIASDLKLKFPDASEREIRRLVVELIARGLHLLDIKGILVQTKVDVPYVEEWVQHLQLHPQWKKQNKFSVQITGPRI